MDFADTNAVPPHHVTHQCKQAHVCGYVKKSWAKPEFLIGGPMYDVEEIVQFNQPNVQCMHSAYTFYP